MKKYIVLLIVILAFALRIYNVAKIPPSLSWDEVSIGYNAYSILTTGRDEHGRFLPFDTFVAYGDYKPPLAIYATVPFVAIFGLNELAVRLPSVLFGTLSVFLAYLLVQELLHKKSLAMLSALLLAISPWHINISRAGFEANIALALAILGIYLVLRARNVPKLWYVAWLPFAAAIYTFNSSRVFVPLIAPALVLFCWKYVRKNLKPFFIGVVIAAVVTAPIFPHLLSKQARLRFTEVNIFTDLAVVETSNTRIARESTSLIGKIVNNRRVGYARSFVLHFLDNLQPRFLFITGDGNPKFSIQDVGQLYMIEAPFLVVGAIALFSEYPAVAGLLAYWMIAAIIPAATARETPHALRILNSLPTWQIFVAYGILTSVRFVKRRWFTALVVVAYGVSITYYLHTYYRHYPYDYSGEWQYGYKQAIAKILPVASRYNHIVISDSIGRPYMYTLFYTQTDPREFWAAKKDYFDAAGFYHVDGFGKYSFGGMLPDKLDGKTLYVWDAVPKGATLIDTIKLLDGIPVLYIFT